MEHQTIQNMFTRLKWDANMEQIRNDIVIVYRHRGAPNDERSVNFSEINIEGMTITLTDRNGIAFWLPFHRILRVFNQKTNEILYQKRDGQKENK
jgi:uncharacterized protein (UPF0248 family)